MNEERDLRRAGGAGMIAAIAMVAAQLLWRTVDSTNGVVQALPEFIATAIARLTPVSLFGVITETYGSWAKRTLLTVCVLGIIAVGIWAGRLAWRIAGPPAPSFARRLLGGLAAAGILLAATLFLILPIAHLGIAARSSSYTGSILIQLIVTFALFALVFAALTGEAQPETAADGATVSRRAVALSGAWFALALGGTVAIIASLIDMFRIKPLTSAQIAEQENAVLQIVQTQTAASPVASPLAGAELFAMAQSSGHLTPILTETRDFYHVSKNFTDPTVSSDGWTLEIGGAVTTPLSFTLDQLTQMATTKKITTLCCISNEINGDLVSTAEWTGLPLADLLNQAGVSPTGVDLKFTGADDYTDSIPVSVGLDPNVLLVVGMNGQTLPDDHGYPARIIVPPIYGMKNVKWLSKVEVVEADYLGYWQERGWNDTATYQIWGRIDYPTGGTIDPGAQIMCGLASAGDRGIQRVEVSLDNGQTWADAELEAPLNGRFTWVRWAYSFNAVTGDYKAIMRATDGTGTLMRQDQNPPLPDGATGWVKRSFKVR